MKVLSIRIDLRGRFSAVLSTFYLVFRYRNRIPAGNKKYGYDCKGDQCSKLNMMDNHTFKLTGRTFIEWHLYDVKEVKERSEYKKDNKE